MTMRILVADDEAAQRRMLAGFLEKQGFEVHTAENGARALERFQAMPFQLILLDHRMPDLTGNEVLARIRDIDPSVRAILITAFGSVDTAVTAMKLGADDFLEKPVNLTELLEKIRQIEQRVAVEADVADLSAAMDRKKLPVRIIGDSAPVRETLSLAMRVAPTPWTVLIRGETGTGKELVARLIHLLSEGGKGPFTEVNCGAIPENLFESELFGHAKGAFTGAVGDRRGRFEMADGGTLFLDEIGELPLSLQPKLLRALQEKRITRVGGNEAVTVNARVIAATNRDLSRSVEQGRFREDLYYRLKVLDIEVPPLRRRKEDIPALIAHFLERYALRPVTFDPDATATLMKYAFPGNVRELEHIVQRTATLARSGVIHPGDLPPEVRFHQAAAPGNLSESLASVEKEMLTTTLEANGWVQTRAAEALGISERVLRYKMKKHGIARS